MDLPVYLDQAIAECERRISRLGFQLSVDVGYVDSPEADPGDVDYYRCQVELQRLEEDYLRRRLAVLQRWAASPGKPAGGP